MAVAQAGVIHGGDGGHHFGGSGGDLHNQVQYENLGSYVGKHNVPPKEIKVTKTVAVKVPVPYVVKVPHSIPYPVQVVKTFPVPVTKIVKVHEQVPVHPPNYHHQQQHLEQSSNQVEQIKESGRYTSPVFDISAFHPSVLTKGSGYQQSEQQQEVGQAGGAYEGHQGYGQGGYESQQQAVYQGQGGHYGGYEQQGQEAEGKGHKEYQEALQKYHSQIAQHQAQNQHQTQEVQQIQQQIQHQMQHQPQQQQIQYHYVQQDQVEDQGKEQAYEVPVVATGNHHFDQYQQQQGQIAEVGHYQQSQEQPEYQYVQQEQNQHQYQPQQVQYEQHQQVQEEESHKIPPAQHYQYFHLGSHSEPQVHYELRPQTQKYQMEDIARTILNMHQNNQQQRQQKQHQYQIPQVPQQEAFHHNVGVSVLKEVEAPQLGHHQQHYQAFNGQGEGQGKSYETQQYIAQNNNGLYKAQH